MGSYGNALRPTRPHDLVDGRHFQQLFHDRALAVSTNDWKNQPEISVDILVYGCEIPRVTGVGVTAMEKDECCLRVRLDNWLHVGWRGQCEGDVRIADTGVELDCMKALLRSDAVQPW